MSLLNELESPGAFRPISPGILMEHCKPPFGTATISQKPSPNLELSRSTNSLTRNKFFEYNSLDYAINFLK